MSSLASDSRPTPKLFSLYTPSMRGITILQKFTEQHIQFARLPSHAAASPHRQASTETCDPCRTTIYRTRCLGPGPGWAFAPPHGAGRQGLAKVTFCGDCWVGFRGLRWPVALAKLKPISKLCQALDFEMASEFIRHFHGSSDPQLSATLSVGARICRACRIPH